MLHTQEVAGSIPAPPTSSGLAEVDARLSPDYAGGVRSSYHRMVAPNIAAAKPYEKTTPTRHA